MQSLRSFVRPSNALCKKYMRPYMHYARSISNLTTLKQNAVTNTAKDGSEAQWQSANPLQIPVPDGPDKPLSPKLEQLVASITTLNLIEVSELSQALKKRLNLPDAPMAMGAMPFAAAPAEEEEAAPKIVKTSFTVKLMKFDEKQKVPIIKELKNLMEGMNLVQAKKFIESAPAVVKADIAEDEAKKLKEALSKVGGECIIE